jgi:uncharacterized protein with von Willebrand factor type A (vWA) domain
MFTNFFYTLKEKKVPVSITEWMTLMDALSRGYISDLEEFYYLARAILVKNEGHFDQYDAAFQQYFKGVETPSEITEQIMEWLKDPINQLVLSEEEKALFDKMDFDELMKEFEKRLKEQTEQHDGGSRWIGRGGRSPFGHSGYHPAGIRVGGQSGHNRAVQIAQQRKFKNYRSDLTLDIRQMKVVLRALRQLNRVGPEDELNLEKTIDATCKNAGELEFIWQRSRKNAVKVLLLMDVGGSMDPYSMLCSQFFSAAHSSSHFKDFQFYFFHNCIYDHVYQDVERSEQMSTEYLLHALEQDYKLIMVGDARMSMWELVQRYGAIYYYEQNDTPGIEWLRRISDHFNSRVWLNPTTPRFWEHPTVLAISKLFPMYEFTLDGMGEAVRKLVAKSS